MVEKILDQPEIWRIRVDLPDNPLKYLNSYVLPCHKRPLIIDTGFNRPECMAALEAGLKELGVELSQADLLVTHLHGDHSGLAETLARQGCTVYMSQTDHEYLGRMLAGQMWPILEDRFRLEGFPQQDITAQQSFNQARLYAIKQLFPVRPVTGGERLSLAGLSFTAIATPGHTPGHLCLYSEQHQIMFTGDHVLFDITPNITCWSTMRDALGTYLESLEQISRFSTAHALPGHRESGPSLNARIREIQEHHTARLGHIKSILCAEPGLTAFEVAQRLPWSMRGKGWVDFPVTAKWFAMGETLSHLDHLLCLNQVERIDRHGHTRYFVPA